MNNRHERILISDPISKENAEMYDFLFDQMPVAMWEADCTNTVSLLKTFSVADQNTVLHNRYGAEAIEDELINELKISRLNNAWFSLFETEPENDVEVQTKGALTRSGKRAIVVALIRILNNQPGNPQEIEINTNKGQRKRVALQLYLFSNSEGKHIYRRVITAYSDVKIAIKPKTFEQHESDKLSHYLNLMSVLFISLDTRGRVKMANKKLCALIKTSQNEIIQKNWISDYLPENQKEAFKEILRTQIADNESRVEYHECQIISTVGDHYTISWYISALRDTSGFVTEVLFSGIDISRERILEQSNLEMDIQLRQNQKLKSISILARGVAHEINNPLTGLLNYATFLEEEVKDTQLREFAVGIQTEGKRVAEIVNNLLTFARTETGSKQVIQIHKILNKAVMLISKSLMTDHISLNMNKIDNKVSIYCKVQDIQHVILNLLTNSWQALKRKRQYSNSDMEINIYTSTIVMDGDKYLRITVQDTGDGISKQDIDNVFDPFFSGQARTRGVGMGLAVAYGIIHEHQGYISIKSMEGQGTEVYIDLPMENSEHYNAS